MKETRTNRKEIYDGKVIHVVLDDVVLEDGTESKTGYLYV